MLKFNLIVKIIFVISILPNSQTAFIQTAELFNPNDSRLEFKPNGSLLLRSTVENSSSLLQETMIFKTILNAIRLMSLQQHTRNTLNDLNQKMYGDGVEHKFPPFLERVIQRIQTYFSIYKYADTSNNTQPVRVDNRPTTNQSLPSSSSSSSLTYDNYSEIDVNLTSSVDDSNKKNKTTIKPTSVTTKPTKANIRTTTTTTLETTIASTTNGYNFEEAIDEENEFIEIKKSKTMVPKA